jgi:serine O-acetyltransferase
MFATLLRDLRSARDRDPAARSSIEIAICYSGVHAVWSHRISHWLWHRDFKLLARACSALARWLTGVEIHPAAVLGEGVFIDHASGVVIGETAEVGDDVTIYQGVTLGGTSLNPVKRHPTVGNRVTIGAGAKVLGPITIGDDSRIGANAVVVKSVPPNSVVVGVPGQVIARSRPHLATDRPDLESAFMPDLLGSSLQSLLARVDELETIVEGHTDHLAARPSPAGVWSGEDFSI